MPHRFLFVVGLVALSTTCCAQYKSGQEALAKQQQAQKRVDGATEEARRFFASFSVPTAETESAWGMTDFRVFGRDEMVGLMAAGGITVAKVADSPETFEATVPFWCEGRSLDGRGVKLSRQLQIKLLGTEDEAKWEIPSYEFRDDKPLAFSRQLTTWLGWSFGGPILVFLLFWMWTSGWTRAALIIARILTLPLAGYAAHVSFGSSAAVVVCILAYILVAFVLIKALSAIVKR